MPFPDGTPTITLTGTLPSPVAGGPVSGRVILTPSADYLVDANHQAVYFGGGEKTITGGTFSVVLLPNDAEGIEPFGWLWHIDIQPIGGQRRRFWANITGTGTVDISSIIEVPAPGGGSSGSGAVTSVNGKDGTVVLTAADVNAEPSGTVATHSGATDPHGDRAWAVGALLAKAANLADLTDASAARTALGLGAAATRAVGTTAGTVAAGDDSRFSSGGGGTAIRTAEAWITDGAVVDLPSAPSWAIVTTSVGTPIQCSIPAVAGDRVRVHLGMMYNGGHFLDVAMLSSAGAIAVHHASRGASPLAEGAPWFYPSTAFSKVPTIMFTVGSGHLSGGQATFALVHQGTSTGRVYANATYPCLVLLENLGQQPA